MISRTGAIFLALSMALATCSRDTRTAVRHEEPTAATTESRDVICATQDDILQSIAAAAASGDLTSVVPLVATAEDLLALQGLQPAAHSENRTAMNKQMVGDVSSAIERFREVSKPKRALGIQKGEFRTSAPIENVAPSVDQLRDSTVRFQSVGGGTAELTVGLLIRVGRCWKILYM